MLPAWLRQEGLFRQREVFLQPVLQLNPQLEYQRPGYQLEACRLVALRLRWWRALGGWRRYAEALPAYPQAQTVLRQQQVLYLQLQESWQLRFSEFRLAAVWRLGLQGRLEKVKLLLAGWFAGSEKFPEWAILNSQECATELLTVFQSSAKARHQVLLAALFPE